VFIGPRGEGVHGAVASIGHGLTEERANGVATRLEILLERRAAAEAASYRLDPVED
jgi:hypothetical protein